MSLWTYEAEAALLQTWRNNEAFSEKKMMLKKDSSMSGSSLNWSLLTCECCVVVKSPKKGEPL